MKKFAINNLLVSIVVSIMFISCDVRITVKNQKGELKTISLSKEEYELIQKGDTIIYSQKISNCLPHLDKPEFESFYVGNIPDFNIVEYNYVESNGDTSFCSTMTTYNKAIVMLID